MEVSTSVYIRSDIVVDKSTKNLVRRLKPGQIAVICHRDLDELGALSLINARARAIINAEVSISGKYPNLGPGLLWEKGIPLIDNVGVALLNRVKDGDELEVVGEKIYLYGKQVARGQVMDAAKITREMGFAQRNLEAVLDGFIDNTMEYAKREKDFILGKLKLKQIGTDFKGRHALVVVRGKDYKRDLSTIRSYMKELRPVLIGVDGGGDALLEFGFIPDVIIGDMDSVSDRALKRCREIIVHGYLDGRAPGMERINQLGLKGQILACPGTSEDIAMLLAYENGADIIVAVGAHTSMIDFLEKGRKGMGSTFLTRLKIGDRLVDAKGVNKLYKENIRVKHIVGLVIAAMIPIAVAGATSPLLKQFCRLLTIRLRLALNF